MSAFLGWSADGANVLANSLSNLGQTFGHAIEKQGQRQLLSDFTNKMAAGDTQGAFQVAGQLGDPNLALKIAEMARTDAADKQLIPTIFGNGASQPGPAAPQPSQPNVVNAATPDIVNTTADKYHINPTDFAKTAWIESRFKPDAHAGGSSAGGLFQFTDPTAKQYGLTNKYDPAANADAAGRLWNDNKAVLTKALGREPTGAELYLAHQQGATGAAKMLANPNAPAASIVGADAIRANGGDANMTAGQFAGMWTDRFNRTQLGRGVEQGPMPADSAPTRTAQNTTTANDANSGYMPPPPVSSSNPWGGSSWGAILEKTNRAIQSPAFYGASEKARTMIKDLNTMAMQQAKFEMDQAGLPQNKIPAEINARREQGRNAGLTGPSLESYALTGNLPKPGDDMTPAQKEMSTEYGKAAVAYRKDAASGNQTIAVLNQMEKLTQDPNFYSGTGSEAILKAKKLASTIGLTVPDGASSNEVFDALSKQLTLAANNGSLGTGVSNSDVAFLQSQNASLDHSPEGNRRLIANAKAVAQRKVEVSKMATAYIKQHGQLDVGFDEQLQQFAETHPLFPEAQASPPGQSPQNPPQRNDGAKLSPPPANELAEARRALAHNVPLSAVTEMLRSKNFSTEGL